MMIPNDIQTAYDMFAASRQTVKWLILGMILLIVFFMLYPSSDTARIYYEIGDVAESDIKAGRDFFVVNDEATGLKRKYTRELIPTVYDHNSNLSAELIKKVDNAFSGIREKIDKLEADLQNAETERLAAEKARLTAEQAGLPPDGSESPQKKDAAAQPPEPPRKTDPQVSAGTAAAPAPKLPSVRELMESGKDAFEKALGFTVNEKFYDILENERFSPMIAVYIKKMLTEIFHNGVVANKEILLKEVDKGIVLRDLETKTENRVSNLHSFYNPAQAKSMAGLIAGMILKNESADVTEVSVFIVRNLVRPDITLNANETEERKKKAASAVSQVKDRVKKGEMIIREGERVNKVHLAKLKILMLEGRQDALFAKAVGNTLMIMSLLLAVYFFFSKLKTVEADVNKNLLFMAGMFTLFFVLTKISYTVVNYAVAETSLSYSTTTFFFLFPMAAGAMIVCLFTGLNTAIAFSVLMASCSVMILENRFEFFIYFLLNSALGAFWVRHCRERSVFIKAGAKLAALNFFLVIFINLYSGGFPGVKILWDCGCAVAGGMAAGIVTAGIAPLIEFSFGYTTDITLLELANLDRPLLKRLMMEAPGTYHHSMVVGTLAEAAAYEAGANPLLAKACGYYHDIGKIKKPLYFIENQAGGVNRHDSLAPSMSSLILLEHVKNGVKMAREYKLGREIIDVIRQHHGTKTITYFYEKAKQKFGENAVKMDDYRYPGPKPQTREATIVMLADAAEAASRSLENPTNSRLKGLVQSLISHTFADGQLDECDLTLRDFHNISERFLKILNGIYHNRIEYPDAANGKKIAGNGGRNGNSNNKRLEWRRTGRGNGAGSGGKRTKRPGTA